MYYCFWSISAFEFSVSAVIPERCSLISSSFCLFPPLWVNVCLLGKEAVAVVVKLVHSSFIFNLRKYFSCLFLIPL